MANVIIYLSQWLYFLTSFVSFDLFYLETFVKNLSVLYIISYSKIHVFLFYETATKCEGLWKFFKFQCSRFLKSLVASNLMMFAIA